MNILKKSYRLPLHLNDSLDFWLELLGNLLLNFASKQKILTVIPFGSVRLERTASRLSRGSGIELAHDVLPVPTGP